MAKNPAKVGVLDSLIEDGRRTRVHRFTVRFVCDSAELETNLRRAILDFVKTELGKEQARSNNGDFNWGDACVGIPAAFWRRYGILSFLGEDPNVPHLVVDHDENFFAHEE